MRAMWLLLASLLFFVGCVAQDQQIIDSLKRRLELESGADCYAVLYGLAVEYVDKDNESALYYIEEAERLALENSDTFAIVKSVRAKGQVYFRLGKVREAISMYDKIYPLARKTKFTKERMLITNMYGSAHFMQGQFDQALRYHLEAYEIAVNEKDSSGMAMVLNNVGITYYKLKDYAKGLRYLKRGYELDRAIGDVGFDTPMNISLCYVNLQDFENAEKFLNESLVICGADCPDYAMVHLKYTRGCMLMGLQKYEAATTEFLGSSALAEQVGNLGMQLDNIYLLTEIYLKKKRIYEALKYLRKGENIINGGTPFNLEMIKIYFRLAETYMLLRDFEKAAYYQNKYIALKDSVYDESVTTNLMQTEADFVERENQVKIAAQNKLLSLKEENIQRQRFLNIVIGLLAVMILAFLIFLWRDYLRKKKVNVLLEAMVRHRTAELETGREGLLKALAERDIRLSRHAEAVGEAIKSLEGLASLGSKELQDPAAREYIGKLHEVSTSLSRYAQPPE